MDELGRQDHGYARSERRKGKGARRAMSRAAKVRTFDKAVDTWFVSLTECVYVKYVYTSRTCENRRNLQCLKANTASCQSHIRSTSWSLPLCQYKHCLRSYSRHLSVQHRHIARMNRLSLSTTIIPQSSLPYIIDHPISNLPQSTKQHSRCV